MLININHIKEFLIIINNDLARLGNRAELEQTCELLMWSLGPPGDGGHHLGKP